MSQYKLPSFSRGELDPALHARTDLDGYRTGLHTLRNMIVMRAGGVQNRSGFKFIAPVKFSTTAGRATRVIPFVFNTDDGNAYAIEVGYLYLRFYKNGGQVRLAAKNISAITQANPGVITTSSAHGLVAGDEFYVSGIVGMKELNGRWFKAGTVGGAGTTVQLLDRDGNNINTTSLTAYSSGGTTEEVYEVTTTYDDDDVMELSFSQLNDTMIFAHASYPPKSLVRTSDTSWAFSSTSFGSSILGTAVTVASGTRGAAGRNTYKYKISAVDKETGIEDPPGTTRTGTVTNATQANPVVVTVNSHGYNNGDQVYFTGIGGMTEISSTGRDENLYFTVANKTANTFELSGINGTAYTAYTSGGSSFATHVTIISAKAPTPARPCTLTWTPITPSGYTVSKYVIYRELNGVYGYLGLSEGNTFSDVGSTPAVEDTPKKVKAPFASSGNYPSKIAFCQQRLFMANSTNDPNSVWGSRINSFYEFRSPHDPQQDADPLEFELVGSRALQVRALADLGRLVVFTTEGEHITNGDGSGALTPSDINPRQVSANGATAVAPMLVNSSALYVQARGSQVRDLFKTPVQIDGYDGDERSIWSSHLFRGYTIVDGAYQQVPDSIAWFVRSDGDLNAMTYVREQSMFGWHRHDTQGSFESVCTVPESSEDALYAVVTRTVNGASVRQIERLSTRAIADGTNAIKDNVFVDSSISFDGRNTGACTMTITTGTTYVAGQTLTLTASVAGTFTSDMVGDKINVTSTTGTVVHLLITAYTSGTVVSVTGDIDIPANLQNTARTTWARARKTIPQLWHLEGLSVSVQGDSFVEANPNNSSLTTRTVSSGSVTLGRWYEVLHIGLPYVSDLKTLAIDTADPFQNLTGRMKLVQNVMTQVYRSRGIYAGETLPSSDSSTTGLSEMIPLPSGQSYDSTPTLTTDVKDVDIHGEWNTGGQVVIRQLDPLPCTILSVVPIGHIIPRSR